MRLTGKCEIEFYKYSKNKGLENWNPKKYSLDVVIAMMFGVYLDFFYSKGIALEILIVEYGWDENGTIHECQVYYLGEPISDIIPYPEAKEFLVKKANEIFNNR